MVGDRATREQAIGFFRQRFLGLYDTWGHENVAGLEGDSRSLATLGADHFIIGEPAECIELIERYRSLGIEEIACLMNFGGPEPDWVESSMRLFAERVMPRFAAAERD